MSGWLAMRVRMEAVRVAFGLMVRVDMGRFSFILIALLAVIALNAGLP
jgi:hypothetical protein